MGTVHMLVDSGEFLQTTRFRWIEVDNDYWVHDTQQGEGLRHLGNPAKMFCDENGENCFLPGTKRFYDALNMYFECEQAEIARQYYGIDYKEDVASYG